MMKISLRPSTSTGAVQINKAEPITMNTNTYNPTIEKLKAKISGMGHDGYKAAALPKNKQGEAIPPQPSGMNPEALAPVASALAKASETKPNNTPSVEAPKAPSEAPAQPLSPQYALLAQQQKALRKAQQEFKASQEAWKQEQAQYIRKDAFTSDPLKALTEAGTSYDKLVEHTLNQANPDPNQPLYDRIKQLEDKLAGVDTNMKTRDQQAYDQAVNQIRSDVKLLVDSDPAYEVTKATGNTEEVVKFIQEVFKAEGTILSVEEASKAVESELRDRTFKDVQRYSSLQAIKSRLAPAPAETKEAGKEAKPQASTTPTLTNSMGSTKPLSPRERAILAFEEAAKKKAS